MLKTLLLSKQTRKVADIVVSPFTFFSSVWLRYIRSRNVSEMPVSKLIFEKVGVFPINDHYYEPLFNVSKHTNKPFNEDRHLPGLDLNEIEQVAVVSRFHYNEELKAIPLNKQDELDYYFNNGSYPAGDAELLYNMLRTYKPKKIIEVGCGFSTLMIQKALKRNMEEGVACEHICIEPYEMKWLEQLKIQVIRKRVEEIEPSFFQSLGDNDLLFIDSSHMIRPQGDVLFEFLQLLPTLNKGVLVHVHDIFTPKDYPEHWIKDLNRFWNEQYLLEAFLSHNNQFKVLLAANFMRHHHEELLLSKCPILAAQVVKEPGSFWFQRL